MTSQGVDCARRSGTSNYGRRVDAVVFDYTGVLTGPVSDSIAAWLEADGIEPVSSSRTLKAWLAPDAADDAPIHRLETGDLPAAEAEVLLAGELSTRDGRPVESHGLLARMFADLRSNPMMFALAERLRDVGVRVALLSNSWGNTLPRTRIDALFDPVVISSEVGLRKPLAPIYHLTLDRLDLVPDRVVLVDDSLPNVLGAAAVGMRALLHTGAATTEAALANLTLLPTGANS